MSDKNTISVLLVQPGKRPRMVEIENSLEAMQALIGEDIEEYMPFDDEVALVCNDMENGSDLPLNRAIYKEKEADMTCRERKERELLDIVRGDFFLCRATVESPDIESLPKEMADKYSELFKNPERFEKTEGGYKVVPFKPVGEDMER